MQRSVNYLMSGPAHLPYLTASLASLRRHYTGAVFVYAWPESYSLVKLIAQDQRLGITCIERQPAYRGKNDQFIDKLLMMQQMETEVGLYLDADTMVVGGIDPLFEAAAKHGFVVTQFNNWMAHFRTIRGRIGRLSGREGINQTAVQELLNGTYPSVNGGVFACLRSTDILKQWHAATMAVKDIFIADETVLHTFITGHYFGVGVVPGGAFNCSPKYQPAALADEDVRIWHFHGDCNVRPSKCQKGVDLWLPEYKQCLADNTGYINSWIDGAIEKNRHLKALVKA